MAELSLDMFVKADQDFETAQYRILAGLKETRDAFSGNAIYPHLRALINLYTTLVRVSENLDQLRSAGPRTLKEIDLVHQALVYENPEVGSQEIAFVDDLIAWALPQIRSTIEEGRAIFEFVDENLLLEEVGIVPSYVQEGYFIVSDRLGQRLHILQYTLSIFTRADERYRTLRTTTLKTIEQRAVERTPQSIKIDLVSENRDLPNPATYFLDSAVDFPYEPTVLPVAKRKLLRHLSGIGGVA